MTSEMFSFCASVIISLFIPLLIFCFGLFILSFIHSPNSVNKKSKNKPYDGEPYSIMTDGNIHVRVPISFLKPSERIYKERFRFLRSVGENDSINYIVTIIGFGRWQMVGSMFSDGYGEYHYSSTVQMFLNASSLLEIRTDNVERIICDAFMESSSLYESKDFDIGL